MLDPEAVDAFFATYEAVKLPTDVFLMIDFISYLIWKID